MKTSDFGKVIRALRKHFPISASVEVRRSPMKGDLLGRTRFTGEYFKIHINSNQCNEVQCDVMLHEWAHVCAMERAYSHDATWGVIYADIYDTMVEQLKITTEK